MPDYTIMPELITAVNEDEEIVPLPGKSVLVRVLTTQAEMTLTTDANGVTPATVITLVHGLIPPRELRVLYMCKHLGIGSSALRLLEKVVV